VTGIITDPSPAKRHSLWRRLYHGETEFDFIGRWKLWFGISGAIILIGMVALVGRGLNLGIDFTGGNVWQVPAHSATVADATKTMQDLGFNDLKIQTVGKDLRVQAETITGSEAKRQQRNQQVITGLAKLTGVDENEVVVNQVGPSWGREISSKAIRALVIFLIAIGIYITVRFELKMALGTLAALFHDLLIVISVYAILQLPVTPATVIAILTILGFSIYDGIVVFDRVDENARLLSGAGTMTYTDMVNLSLNQVLMRSLNTQVTALLPIGAVLVIGSLLLGASTLEDFGLALFVGQLSGAYSSIFIASPALALLKEQEPRYKTLRKRLEERGVRTNRKATRSELEHDLATVASGSSVSGTKATTAAGGSSGGARTGTATASRNGGSKATKSTAKSSKSAAKSGTGRPAGSTTKAAKAPGTIPPRPRKKGKRR
jgi:preprotein translocase subunit SecF